MPTGYTAELMEKGMDFKSFVLRCSRAFGALIMMRDAPMDAPVPKKFAPSDYHLKALTEAQKKHEMLSVMTYDEQIAFGQTEKDEVVKRAYERRGRDKIQNERLSEMQSQVMAWNPPTADHEGLKNFMLDQIKTSMNDLGNIEKKIEAAEIKSPMAFYIASVSSALWDIKYHTEENRTEIERAASRTEWVRDLYKSIGANRISQL